MSDLHLPSPGLFFGSVLFNKDLIDFTEIQNIWSDRFGPSVLFDHPFFPMKEYYAKQMGDVFSLSRIVFASLRPESREKIVEHKLWADQLEKKFKGSQMLRPLNLDIGILTLENVVLATGKSFAHRVYLREGVYGDLNLHFEHKTMKPLPWAYPDYSHPDFIKFFNWMRGFLLKKNSEKNT